MATAKKSLLIIAHPDDETLFFGGQVLENSDKNWLAVCVTDGNGDGRASERKDEWNRAVSKLGINESEYWEFPDDYNSLLDEEEFRKRLAKLPEAFEVYTHGPLGEYGHPHHVQVSLLVHQFYQKKVPIFHPDVLGLVSGRQLSEKAWKVKLEIMEEIYAKEYKRFVDLLRASRLEGFLECEIQSVEAIANYLLGRQSNLIDTLGPYSHYKKSLLLLKEKLSVRMF